MEIDALLQSKLKVSPREKLDPEDILGELSPSMKVDKTEFMKRVYRELTGAQSQINFTEAVFEATIAAYVGQVFDLISKKEAAVFQLVEPGAELSLYQNEFFGVPS